MTGSLSTEAWENEKSSIRCAYAYVFVSPAHTYFSYAYVHAYAYVKVWTTPKPFIALW